MKQTLLADLTQALIMPFLNKEFYPSKRDKCAKPPVDYFYEVKYILKREGDNQVAKGVPYVNPHKNPSRRDLIRHIGKAELKHLPAFSSVPMEVV